jgi:cobalt/nickel transport system permease protein
MKLALDKYCHIKSAIHSWEQSSKLVALLILIFSFAFVTKLSLLPLMVIITLVIFFLSKLPLSFLISRLRYPGFFILAVIIFLPFVAGTTVIWDGRILTIKQEGCLEVIRIVTRFVCILTVSLVLFGTAPFLKTIKAMRLLGLSPIIVDMMLLSYRYLESLGEVLTTMQRAIKLRGFQSHNFSRKNLEVMAELTGTLLVRSYDQSQRVYHAMILRGYGSNNNGHLLKKTKIKRDKVSYLYSVITIMIALALIIAEIYL